MSDTAGNLILDTLSGASIDRLAPQVTRQGIGTILSTPDEVPQYVYFPHAGSVISITRSTEEGSTVESGVVANEGLTPIQAAITAPVPTGNQGVVQRDGMFSRVEVQRLSALFNSDPEFRDRVLSFTSCFMTQITQNLVCNRLHAIEQRLAKWLLLMRERAGTDSLPLTHEFLAHMLGIHRPGVSLAVGTLEADGLIHHARNLITVKDFEGLMLRSCECFNVVHEALCRYRESFANVRQHTDCAVVNQ